MEEEYYEEAIHLFELERYKECLSYLIKLYDNGYKKCEILEFINGAFIIPNDDEFKDTYNKNICKFAINAVYEELPLYFIFIDEDQYYIFDNENDRFCGLLDCRENENIDCDETITEEIMFVGVWDIRLIMNEILRNSYSNMSWYLLPDNYAKAVSFLKVPNLAERFLRNLIIFKDENHIKSFFHSYKSYYLPKTIIGNGNLQNYKEILNKEHEYRLTKEGRNEDNILLSICIPSFNRGNSVLEAVKTFLTTDYDAEVEIIITDDASKMHLEEYKELENINDARLTYIRRNKNFGFKLNMLETYKIAKGKFMVMCSDEDCIILSALPYYLNILRNNPDVSLVGSNSIGPNGRGQGEQEIQKAGLNALMETYLTSYFTGFIMNKKYIDAENMLQTIEEIDNAMANYYPQGILEMWLSIEGDVIRDSTPLWIEGKVETTTWEMDKKFDFMPVYATVEERVKQIVSIMDIAKNVLKLNLHCMVNFYQKVCYKYYYLVLMMKEQYTKSGYDTKDVLDVLYDTLNKEIVKSPFKEHEAVAKDMVSILEIIDKIHREGV